MDLRRLCKNLYRSRCLSQFALAEQLVSAAESTARNHYLGTHMEYSIETEAGTLFATCPKVERPLAAGDKVALVLAPRGVIVVEDQAA